MLAMKHKDQEDLKGFQLDSDYHDNNDFQLESPVVEADSADSDTLQTELFLPEQNPESPEQDDQLDLIGLEKPIHSLTIEGVAKPLKFHFANNLLESLEAQNIHVPYQCREGYCGGCRTDLIEGEVAYLQEPMAWINEGEILPCCCVPKTALTLKLKG
ncbi:MAG: ferredoxin [Bermanella sp.]|jgi:ferredoxin